MYISSSTCAALVRIISAHSKHMQIMRAVIDMNGCCAGYRHFMMLALSIFVKERFSRILRYVYSIVHERST